MSKKQFEGGVSLVPNHSKNTLLINTPYRTHIFGIHLYEPFAGCQKLDEDKVNITGSWI